jgi:hypothetical protein
MHDRLRYLSLSARVLLREDAWVFIIPGLILLITGAWTHYFVETSDWDPATGILQAELLGPLLAAFLCAGLLDPEQRRGAHEIVFTKPHSPAVLLGTRLALALFGALLLLFGLLLSYQLRFGNALLLRALLLAVPPCLFIGLVAVTASHFGRSLVTGFAVPLAFWLWDSSVGMFFNPLLVLPAGYAAAMQPGVPGEVLAGKLIMVAIAIVLFTLNVRALRRSQAA